MIYALNSPTAEALANLGTLVWTAWTIWAIRELHRRPRTTKETL